MDDLKREIAALKARFRLMTLSLVGLMTVVVMAGGGAEAVARTLVEAAAWKVGTKNLAGSATLDRLTVTGDVDTARIQITSANLELAPQTTAQLPASPTPGALAYDSTLGALKYANASGWVEPGGGLVFIEKLTQAANGQSATFASVLNGDVDGIYFLSMRIKSASGASGDSYSLQPNNLATNQSSRVWVIAADNTLGASSSTIMQLNRSSGAGTNNTYMITVWFDARKTVGATTQVRSFVSQHSRVGTYESGGCGGGWTDITTNVTSLRIWAGNANGIGAGSEFVLYKLKQS